MRVKQNNGAIIQIAPLFVQSQQLLQNRLVYAVERNVFLPRDGEAVFYAEVLNRQKPPLEIAGKRIKSIVVSGEVK